MPTPLFSQDHQTPPESGPAVPPWRQRLTATARSTGTWLRQRADVVADWVRQQPPRRIGLGIAAVAGIATLLAWWLRPDHPSPSTTPETTPQWLVEIQHIALWEKLYGTVAGYAADHASAAGMPPWLLLTLWTGLGASLLVTSWLSTRSRFAVATLGFWIWLAATTWIIWTHTPGSSPVPAALAAGLGLTLSAAPWTVLPVAALVVLGLAG